VSTSQIELLSRISGQNEYFHYLSELLLASDDVLDSEGALEWFSTLSENDTAKLLETADTHHVTVRAFRALQRLAIKHGDRALGDWAAAAVSAEQDRVQRALVFLDAICEGLRTTGSQVVVIKSLEHWPDLGSDLDLFTTANDHAVMYVMAHRFHSEVLPRSWGDRLAHKWNFRVPGLPEAVEVHVARLGQTGEHIELARRIAARSVIREVHGHNLRVPAAEGAIILATLQRMYRHFYLRLCDIVDVSILFERGSIDFDELRATAEPAGIWPGVATFLKIVSDYLHSYRGHGLELPAQVLTDAEFGGEKIYCRGSFLRIPILWQGAKLYTMQMSKTVSRGNLPAFFRLSLLPCLGAAAAVEYKATGSDKGVW
jgi:Uncharacterised nucleotidyltransferase